MKVLRSLVALAITSLMLVNSVPVLGGSSVSSSSQDEDKDVVSVEDINTALQTGIPRAFEILHLEAKEFGITVDEELRLGEPIQIPHVVNHRVEAVNEIVQFPILAKDKVVAFTTVCRVDGQLLFGDLNRSFVEEINALIKMDPQESYELYVTDENQVLAYTSNDAPLLLQGGKISSSSMMMQASTNGYEFNRSYTSLYTNRVSADMLKGKTISEQTLQDYFSTDGLKEYISTETNGEPYSEALSRPGHDLFDALTQAETFNDMQAILAVSIPSGGVGDYLDGYRTVAQGSYDICWAATVASMVRWHKPTVYPNLSATQVCTKIGHKYTSGSVNDTLSALSSYLPISTYSYKYLGDSMTRVQIREHINNEKPAAMFAWPADVQPGSTIGHATALNGYLTWSDGMFSPRYMNPGTNTNEHCYLQKYGDDFFYQYNSKRYKWSSGLIRG